MEFEDRLRFKFVAVDEKAADRHLSTVPGMADLPLLHLRHLMNC